MAHLKKLNNKQIIIFIAAIVGIILCIKFFYIKNEVYILKQYNQAGQLIGTNEYIIRNGDTIMQGKFVNYNDKGVKISEGQFVDNDVYGNCKYFYGNGKIEEIHFRKNKDITLESKWNYPNGQLERYVMNTHFGEPIFIIKYDKRNIVHSYKGNPQLEIYQHKINIENHEVKQNNVSLKIGDTLKYSYIVANIPNAERSFTIENVGVQNAKTKRILKSIPPTQIDVKEVLIKKGVNTIRSIVKYEFKDKVTPVFIDTLSFDVNVN
ncbi:hypothetical protein [Flavobacterium aquatile]|uniref:MORN repeat protein n=1 Tax=Flavobacterium aquatile LMG 4008 = ATCC 11947 TaxID=1453498 RepID=A0A095U3Z7_9FLAO|nr:hypothetical protein [Flavobacterium aquatile]KGD69333.1 hypothetical protein LG45_00710 [Flavobacterium aquatile LMG 4008 = ATCC 11947]OXA66213.1 hypothetical protein B0A61_13170 [Flavobacterium aquatile LMG 4008 = ATCC 11947]GEC77707.1 hypothetical protein FAQ01_05770 [Flavobacterium aquatile]